jgi:selenocysteine lyase/cysteine desulfurase
MLKPQLDSVPGHEAKNHRERNYDDRHVTGSVAPHFYNTEYDIDRLLAALP